MKIPWYILLMHKFNHRYPRIVSRRYPDTDLEPETITPGSVVAGSKVVMFDKNNTQKLLGHKAYVEWSTSGEVCITITGFSVKGAKGLYDRMQEIDVEEITELCKECGLPLNICVCEDVKKMLE